MLAVDDSSDLTDGSCRSPAEEEEEEEESWAQREAS
jgi:hypothetical protein